MVLIMNSMVIVDLDSETHFLLKKIKAIMKRKNPAFRVNNTVVVKHSLKKVEGDKDYGIRSNNVD